MKEAMKEEKEGEAQAMRRILKDTEALQMACLKYRRAVAGGGVDPLWRWFAISGWILVIILAAVAARGSVVTETFLDAMEQVESGMDARAVGDQGRSRGSFQFHAAAWRMVNDWRAKRGQKAVGFSMGSHDRVVARQFALEYLRWLETSLASARGASPAIDHLYAAWNLGFAGFQRRGFQMSRCPAKTRDAAKRVGNLVKWAEQQ